MNWISMLYVGNPFAFWTIVAFVVLCAIGILVTPLVDAEFDAEMQRHEEEQEPAGDKPASYDKVWRADE